MKQLICAAISLLILASCEKVIRAELIDTEPQLVIEGNISDQPGSLEVRLSVSTGFYDTSGFPAITDATVTLSDNAGNTVALAMGDPGVYTSPGITGVPGRVYTLVVTVDDREYTSVCRMPEPVVCQQVYAMMQEAHGNKRRFVIPVYEDPAGIGNHYRFKLRAEGVPVDKILVRSDKLTDGTLVTQPLGPFFDEMVPGDSVLVDLQAIDASVYDYFQGLEQSLSMQNAAPANPPSNFSGGCLGYFSTYASSKKWVVITE